MLYLHLYKLCAQANKIPNLSLFNPHSDFKSIYYRSPFITDLIWSFFSLLIIFVFPNSFVYFHIKMLFSLQGENEIFPHTSFFKILFVSTYAFLTIDHSTTH